MHQSNNPFPFGRVGAVDPGLSLSGTRARSLLGVRARAAASMPHLPFTSAYPSFAVKDARGFNATNDMDGAFHDPTRGAGWERQQTKSPGVKRSTTAGSLNAPNTPNTRAAARTTSLGSIPPKSADPATAGRVPRRLAQWSATSAAFCGAMGHHTFGGERSGQARPALADVQHHVTRHPCDATPGPGKYHADGAKLSKETFSTYTDEAASVGRIRRSAVTGGMAWLGQASFQSRFAPPAPFSTPGPGAYDTQLSDFDALWRPCPPANASKAMVSPASTSRQGLSRQDHSVRGSTVVFGTATRSSAYPRGGQSEAARFGVHADRPPAATNYSPLTHQDIVYLSMNTRGRSPPPHYGKVGQMGGPPTVKVFELSRR